MDCARKIIDTARQMVDEVLTRLADRLHDCEEITIRAVMARGYYCHKNCKRNYLRNPLKEPKSDTCVSQSQSQLRKEWLIRTLTYIDKVLANEECCTVADLTVFACSLCDEGEILTNTFIPRDMNGKTLRHILINVDFGLQVSFCDRAD